MSYQAVVVMIAFACGAATVFVAMRPLPQSFNECMLEQMRGVTADFSPFAVAICQQRTGQSLQQAVRESLPATGRP